MTTTAPGLTGAQANDHALRLISVGVELPRVALLTGLSEEHVQKLFNNFDPTQVMSTRGHRNLVVDEVGLDLLEPNPRNPRRSMRGIDELAASIVAHGILQPIVVARRGDRYRILAGHRRWHAARKAGLPTVPVVIRGDLTGADEVAAMLVENLQREQLNPIDQAIALGKLYESGVSQPEIGRMVGKSPAWVCNQLSLLELNAEEQARVLAGQVSATVATDLVREDRAGRRAKAGTPVRGRPIGDERYHLSGRHPLYELARERCIAEGHHGQGGRPRLPSTAKDVNACGECWEAEIRRDERSLA